MMNIAVVLCTITLFLFFKEVIGELALRII